MPMNRDRMVQLCVIMDRELYEQLRKYGYEYDMKYTEIIRGLLRKHFESGEEPDYDYFY